MKRSKGTSMDLQAPEIREQVRLKLMGLGGLSLAAQKAKISYNRLSRILNGWVLARPEDIERLSAYLEGRS